MFVLSAKNAEVGVLGLRRLELSLGLGDGLVGVDAGFVKRLGETQGFLVGDDRVVQQFLKSVLAANVEIIDGDFGFNHQASVFQVGGTRLRRVCICAHVISNAAEEVGCPSGVEGQGIVGNHLRRDHYAGSGTAG